MIRWLPLLLLAGCAQTSQIAVRTAKVSVPIAVRVQAPTELVAPYQLGAPLVFVPPADPAASSALTVDGEKALRDLIEDLMARDQAWRAWASP